MGRRVSKGSEGWEECWGVRLERLIFRSAALLGYVGVKVRSMTEDSGAIAKSLSQATSRSDEQLSSWVLI